MSTWSQERGKAHCLSFLSLIGSLLSPRNKKKSFSCRQNKPLEEAEGVENPHSPNTSLNQRSLAVGCCIPEPIQQVTNKKWPISWMTLLCQQDKIYMCIKEEIESLVLSTWFWVIFSCIMLVLSCAGHWRMGGWARGTPSRQQHVHFRFHHLFCFYNKLLRV